jgi:hypothetical protein
LPNSMGRLVTALGPHCATEQMLKTPLARELPIPVSLDNPVGVEKQRSRLSGWLAEA